MTDVKYIGGNPVCDVTAREHIEQVNNDVYFVRKGLRLSGTNTFTAGSKWADQGEAVSDPKYGRFGRTFGKDRSAVLCFENNDYIMSIGAYTSDSGASINTSPRITINSFEKFVLPSDWSYIGLDFKRVDGADVNESDGDVIRSNLFVYDVCDSESYYTKNLIGNIPNVPYPVLLPPNTTLTIFTSDGSDFDGSVQLQTLDKNKEQISYWTLSAGVNFRTIITSISKGTAYYVRINKPSNVPLMLMYGVKPSNMSFTPYFPPNKALADRLYLGAEQRKIKVCSWNVGNFSYGTAGDGAGTDAMYDQFIDTFKKCGANVYLFDEWDHYWNFSQEILSKDKLGFLKPYWSMYDDATQGRYVNQVIASDFPIVYQNRKYYVDGESRHFVDVIHNICGKPVHFVSTHLPWSSVVRRDNDIQILQDYLSNVGAEYAVICGDFNSGISTADNPPTTAEEMYALLLHDKEQWTDAGYISSQGTFWGKTNINYYINTGKTPPSEIYPVRAYDNIVVTPNIAITNVYTVDTEASDHYPLLADIVLLD